MRRTSAAAASAAWFLVTGGLGAVAVPWWLTGGRLRDPLPYWAAARVLGVVLIAAGVVPAAHVFVQFARAGGTPVPGAMPSRLVVTGFNRFVRNPVYVGAVTMFVGEGLLFGQPSLFLYAIAVWAAAAAFVRGYEEPVLAARFGADYAAYRRAVPAWIPRWRPWAPPGVGETAVTTEGSVTNDGTA